MGKKSKNAAAEAPGGRDNRFLGWIGGLTSLPAQRSAKTGERTVLKARFETFEKARRSVVPAEDMEPIFPR